MSLEIHSLNPKYLGEPLYMQLYSHLRDGILAGQIRAGERLPSKRQLAADLNMSQNTVIRAYQQLLDEGYIRAKERSGYYVEEISVLYRPLELDVKTPKKGSEEDEKEILYDFGYGGVDNENFPWKILQKTYRKVISAAGEELCRMPQEQGHERLRETLSSYLYRARGFYVEILNK
ncbi:MAG: GntR family transcriptional regulator [Eubacteriales bacterium]|nr:GntR family transcriptional regulator [Eubacteriales bacterium]